MMARLHHCPAPGCDRSVPYHQLACRDDWYRLPHELRGRLTRARSMCGQGSEPHLEVLRECLEWYRDHAR